MGRISTYLKSTKVKAILLVLAVLIAARLCLPWAIKTYANRVLDENPTYQGHIEDIDVHLYRGAYSIHRIDIKKRTGAVPVPFFSSKAIDIMLSWRELFRGQVVARVKFVEPQVNFVDGKEKEDRQAGQGVDWNKWLKDLSPFRLSRIEVERGEVYFKNFQAKPQVDIWLREIDAKLENLTNSEDLSENLFATLTAKALALGDGRMDLFIRINPNTPEETFSVRGKLLAMKLPALNNFFREYGNFDFEKGHGDVVTEIEAKNGKITGYVRPLFKDLEVLEVKNELRRDRDSIFSVVWEATVGAVITLFKNQPNDQFATEVPLSGRIKNPSTNIIATIGGVLRNAFISAFKPFYRGEGKVDRKDKRTTKN